MLGLRLAIVALNRIFYWTCWDWGEQLLPSIWCFSGHAGTQLSDCCPQSDLYWTCWDCGEPLLTHSDLFLDMLGLRWAIVVLNQIFTGHALRWGIVALNLIFYWICWDWGEQLPSIWSFSGHTGTEVIVALRLIFFWTCCDSGERCCPQSDVFLDILGLRWVIVALSLIFFWTCCDSVEHCCLNLMFFWTCWDSGEQLLPSIWSFSGHTGTEVSDCCPQSDLFLDMLWLRWALLPSIWCFSGHAGTQVSGCCPQSDLNWTCWDWGEKLFALDLNFFWTCWDWGEWLLASIWSISGHAGTEVRDCCPQSNFFLGMLGLRWVIVALNLIFFWTCWDWGEGLLPSIWSFSGHAGTELRDCCPQSDLFLDMLGLRLAIVALNLIFFWTC